MTLLPQAALILQQLLLSKLQSSALLHLQLQLPLLLLLALQRLKLPIGRAKTKGAVGPSEGP